MSEEDHSDQIAKNQDIHPEGEHPKRTQITTSAVVHASQDDSETSESETEDQPQPNPSTAEVRQADIPAPWSKSEPLTKIHSLLGHMAQGDVYRNDLELVYDRLTGEAIAPEFVPPPQELVEEPLVDHESTDLDVEDDHQQLNDPFDDDAIDFAVSVGEVTIDDDVFEMTPSADQIGTEQGEDSIVEETSDVDDPHRIFGDIKVDEFDQLHQTARTSIGLTSEEIEAELRPQEILDDDSFTRLSDSPEEWEEASADPAEVVRMRQQVSNQSFFEVNAESQKAVIQGKPGVESLSPQGKDEGEDEDTLIDTKMKEKM